MIGRLLPRRLEELPDVVGGHIGQLGHRADHADARWDPVGVQAERFLIARERLAFLVVLHPQIAPLGVNLRAFRLGDALVGVVREGLLERGARSAGQPEVIVFAGKGSIRDDRLERLPAVVSPPVTDSSRPATAASQPFALATAQCFSPRRPGLQRCGRARASSPSGVAGADSTVARLRHLPRPSATRTCSASAARRPAGLSVEPRNGHDASSHTNDTMDCSRCPHPACAARSTRVSSAHAPTTRGQRAIEMVRSPLPRTS
jgi:hypothetical protein